MIPRPTKLRAVPSILFVLAAGGWIGPALAAAPADAEIARHFQERREKLIQTATAIF